MIYIYEHYRNLTRFCCHFQNHADVNFEDEFIFLVKTNPHIQSFTVDDDIGGGTHFSDNLLDASKFLLLIQVQISKI